MQRTKIDLIKGIQVPTRSNRSSVIDIISMSPENLLDRIERFRVVLLCSIKFSLLHLNLVVSEPSNLYLMGSAFLSYHANQTQVK